MMFKEKIKNGFKSFMDISSKILAILWIVYVIYLISK